MTELLEGVRPQRSQTVESNDLTDGVVLYDSSSEVAHHLNPVATLVWELCDAGPSAKLSRPWQKCSRSLTTRRSR